MGIFDLFRSSPARLALTDAMQRQAAADAAAAMADAEIDRRVTAGIRAFTDSNLYFHSGPIANPNTGLLGPQDALSGTIPVGYVFLTDFQLAQLYADPLCRRICQTRPAWIAAAGHRVRTPEGEDQYPDLDAHLGISKAFGQAHALANHLRGGAVFIDVEEDGDPPLSEPMDPRKVRRIRRLTPLGGITLQVVYWQREPDGDPSVHPLWRSFEGPAQPLAYRLMATMRQGGVQGHIHWTRLLYWQGAPVPPDVDGMLACPSTHYALSKLDLCWPAVRRFVTMAANAERIANSHGAWWMRIMNKLALDSSGISTVRGWVEAVASYFNARKIMVMSEGDDVGNVGVPLSGWSELEQAGYIHASASADIPVPLLFTALPKGFTSDDSDWRPQWEGGNLAEYVQFWDPNLRRLYSLQYFIDHGVAPRWLETTPGPWREPTDKERMELHEMGAKELKALREADIIDREEARSRYTPTFTPDIRLKGTDEALERQENATGDALTDAAGDVWVALEVAPADVGPLQHAMPPSVRREPWPHVTLLHAGTTSARGLSDVLRAAAEVAPMVPATVATAALTDLGNEGARVVLLHGGTITRPGSLRSLADRLLRVAAPAVRARQFPAFVPHVTLGYGEGDLSRVEIPPSIRVVALVVRRGEVEVGRFGVGKEAP